MQRSDVQNPEPAAQELKVVTIGGIPTLHVTRAALADRMADDVRRARQGELGNPNIVIASNGSVIAWYHRRPSFRVLVQQADLVDPDGMSLVLATRLLWREPLAERVATTDFILDASAKAAQAGIRFYFLGARPGVAARAAERLKERFPGLEIVGTRHGYFDEGEVPALCDEVRNSGADVLWLGLGSPRQEAFAVANRARLAGLGWIRTCGGLFDHYGADVPRAPRWVQDIGFEWLHRMVLEPQRLGLRYMSTNPAAIFHLLTKTPERR